ncbi:hypothetical protein F4V57_14195 [Acinetobacter qingfengensis]|uniref:Putative exodeoxyribonuclease 8 PDDEXK-like domain-containing protein n=1 Tax=Acinetobacter qingfengensis TaxID=1262585 RepID=A0A1E7QYU9_9GAMM|nr:PD-(D/E)XK nuclease-like domain-containing protein [Acinetobacter qingfengensis]KAA8731000.1 hypothetical protein F4V57_14195 [Acinetobacter qingfengensis]OEY92221.1 hypothetical protein BJI46_05570 [Acinetobacter qingfengensis]
MNTQVDRDQFLAKSELIEKMSNADYHAHPAFSSSQLKDLLRSAAHFYVNSISKEVEKTATAAMDLGTLTHTLFLEPDTFEAEFILMPEDAPSRPTSAQLNAKKPSDETIAKIEWWQAFEQQAAEKQIISIDDFQTATKMAEQLRSLSMFSNMQNHIGMPEASFFFTDPIYDLQLRVRPDWHIKPCDQYPNGLIIDLKTTDDARPHAFSNTCDKFCYDLSAAMYQEGFQQVYQTEGKPNFIFLVVERKAPFNVKQYTGSDCKTDLSPNHWSNG